MRTVTKYRFKLIQAVAGYSRVIVVRADRYSTAQAEAERIARGLHKYVVNGRRIEVLYVGQELNSSERVN
jgi:hypothetical protein